MKILQKLAMGFLIFVLLLLIVGVLSFLELNDIAEPLNNEIPRSIKDVSETSYIDSLSQFIRYYDEVLTQSARNYAFTQDKKWKERYLENEPKLDKIIKEAIRLGGETDKEFFSSIDEANIALVKMEYRSMEYVDNGQKEEAIKLLESEEYWRQKEIYKSGLMQYVQMRGKKYDEALTASTKTVSDITEHTGIQIENDKRTISIIIILSSVFLAITVILFYWSILKPISKLMTSVNEISRGNLDAKIDIHSNDELGLLASAFNKMTGELAKTTISKDYMDSIIRSLFDMLVVVSPEGIIQTVNQATCNVLGYRTEELLGKKVTEILAEDDVLLKGSFLDLIEKGSINNVDKIFLSKDGRKIPVLFSSTMMHNDAGNIQGIICIAKDMTERRSLEERYRCIFDNSSDAILTTDLDNNITSWNRSAEKIFGWKAEEVIGKDLFQLIAPSMLIEENRQIAHDALEGKTVTGLENVLLRKDGASVYVNLTTSLLQDISKNKIGISFVIRDITELRKSEEIQIDKTRLMLANKAKTEFLAIMSHELRTPLNSIIGFSELLKQQVQGELKEKQMHYLDNIISSGRHLLNLINDILDLSRVESGKIELKIEKIPLHEAIEEETDLIKETASKNNVILKIEIDPQIEFVEADRQRFKQVLFNLLGNAVKFSKPEGGTVTLTARKAGDMAEFRVSDTGIGIKKEDMEKLFREFAQLESGSSRKYGGTGLGLSISKQLVELHGGTIVAESRYGEGSTFAFSLPIIANGGK
ncbi:Methanogenesis regulatory histidine kinase FilI [uncultured archaeon]|nr:Methanogenesis regulatory histidine kinase FilI [uncultured archaeon]